MLFRSQIHSSNVISTKLPGNYDCYDGILNFGGELVCSIKVADCLPIYFVNNVSKTLGLLHAGWRGLSAGIIKRYLDMISEKSDNHLSTYAIIGPSIQNCCFLVQEDVINHFDSKFYSKIGAKHFKVNLQKWAFNQILDSNIKEENIFISKNCTYCKIGRAHV